MSGVTSAYNLSRKRSGFFRSSHGAWTFFLVCLIAIEGRTESIQIQFDDIPKLVREKNLHAQGAGLLRDAAAEARGYLARSYLPTLVVTLGGEEFMTGTQPSRSEPYGSLKATVNVFRGGKDLLEDEAIDSRAKVASSEFDRAASEEVKKARIIFWNLVSQREIAKLLEEAIEANQKNLVSANSRIRAGAATETDRLEFEMHRLELDQDLAKLKLASENAERDLAVLLGLQDGSAIQTPLSVGHDHQDELMTAPYKVESHPLVRTLSFRSEEASIKATQQTRWWTPSVDLYAGYGLHTFRERSFDAQAERFESVIGVQLTMDLFDGRVGQAEHRQKVLEAAGLQKESLQTARELQSKIVGARAELKLNHELIHQSEEATKRAQTYLTRTLDEYRRGVKNSPDVLAASERILSVRRRFAELRRDYQLARSELLETLGK